MKNKLILLGFLVFSISNSNAQPITVGVEAGFSAALGKISYTSIPSNVFNVTAIGLRYGARLGVPLHYQLGKTTALYSGLFYNMKGLERNEHSVLPSLGLFYNTIELPLAFVYSKNRQDANNFFIGGGVYLGYAFGAKVTSIDINGQEVSKSVTFGNTILENDMRRVEYGLHFQTGVAFQNGLLFRFVAQRQLNDLAIKNNNLGFNNFGLTQIKNQAYIAITMAYLLKL